MEKMDMQSKGIFPRARDAFKILVLYAHQFLWLGVFLVGFKVELLVSGVLLGFILVLGVEMGHHRYFAHRAFTTGRVFQFVLGVWATAAFQRDVLWWSSMHRRHHRYSDTPNDPHSPFRENDGGFVHAALAWGVAKRNREVDTKYVRDLLEFPELRLLGNWYFLVNIILAGIAYGCGYFGLAGNSGLQTLVWLYVVPHFICQNIISSEATFSHGVPRLLGSYRPFETGDQSLNHIFLGLISFGGGYHNNHHKFPGSARIGLKWFEIDITYMVINVLHRLGVIHKVSIPRQALEYKATP